MQCNCQVSKIRTQTQDFLSWQCFYLPWIKTNSVNNPHPQWAIASCDDSQVPCSDFSPWSVVRILLSGMSRYNGAQLPPHIPINLLGKQDATVDSLFSTFDWDTFTWWAGMLTVFLLSSEPLTRLISIRWVWLLKRCGQLQSRKTLQAWFCTKNTNTN